ncbi:hypothetical protein [[Clostridium] fimetarium]|uniref:RelA/SpoT domain-containing protein n=1 Tax=[Clostridium] fimetarium TaxID=99656 RepID=A0A1I0RXE8_9FIRM|nr:hypothetical protein [[Clostridium] fimetarium]SEW46230.1 hypothetical protein SAMN05421659_13014 [[Clostridium] fimetarium]
MKNIEFEPNNAFCKQNVEQIIVPEIVKSDLLSIIEEKLKKAGFYYRIVYRVKEIDSMVEKLLYKDYRRVGGENENKKMQDLIGIRILLYFADDLTICRNLLDTVFTEPGQWNTIEINESEFKAMKINGIFRLPAYLSKTIMNPILSNYLDDTFEIQVRTNSFEGWHEIEHDLRYKGSAFGIGNEVLARKMNSILATLELCDDSVVKLLEDLGHQHYKDKKWTDMIRCHYRLKMTNEPMIDEIREIYDQDNELAKSFFKFDRKKTIEHFWMNTSERTSQLDVNAVIKVVNLLGPNNEKIKEIFAKIENKKEDVKESNKRKRFEPFQEFGEYTVFSASTYLDISNNNMEISFKKAANYIFSWVRSRFCELLTDIPHEIESYNNEKPGFSVDIVFDVSKYIFSERTTHVDLKIASRIWISNASIILDDRGLKFSVTNEYAEPEERYRDNENVLFSRPNFYGEIADNIGICDVERLREEVMHVRIDEVDKLTALIDDVNRQFPVVVFMAKDNTWINKFDVDYFSYLVGYYAHVKVLNNDNCEKFAQKYNFDMDRYEDSISIFFKGKKPEISYKSDIVEATFEVIKLQDKKYWNEKGCRAYRRQLISEIRGENVE